MSLLRFMAELLRAAYHAWCEFYFAAALKHVGHDHPDSTYITRRMLRSRLIVNDFLRQATR